MVQLPMLTQIQQRQIIQTLNKYDPKEIAVFGSYARGDNTNESDIDLLITFKKPLGFSYFGIADELEKLLSKKVDVATPHSLSKYILPIVEKDKKVIYQVME